MVGASGTGKTTAATTLPGKKLLIDLDGRADSLVGFPDLDIYKLVEPNPTQPKAWLELEALKEEIWSKVRQEKLPYNSLVVDGISSLCRIAMNWSLLLTGAGGKLMQRSPGGGPAQPHYMPAMFKIDRFINSILALPLNILFTAHEELFEDDHLKTLTFYPKITGKLRTEIGNWFNETYCTTTSRGAGGQTRYFFQTTSSGDRRPYIKSALNQLGRYWKDPVELDFDQPLKGFELLLEKRFGKEGGGLVKELNKPKP